MEYGGLGLPARTFARIMEEIAAVWMSVGGIIGSHLIMANLLERAGTEDMKKAYLPKFATGGVTFLYSEEEVLVPYALA